MFRHIARAGRPAALAVAAAVAAATAFATLVVPPQHGYWGAYSKLGMHVGTSPLVLAVTPDTKLDDPGPLGEQGQAALVLHALPAHRELVSALVEDSFLVQKGWQEGEMLSVPVRVEEAELSLSEGTLRAIPWIQGGDFPLAAHDAELKTDAGATVPMLVATKDCWWPGDTNPALGESREIPATVRGFRTTLADTIVPHNPAREPVAGRRPVLVATAIAPRGQTPPAPAADPVDGVDAVRMLIGRSYSVYFVTPDYSGGKIDAGRVLVTMGDWEAEPVAKLLRSQFTYKGVAYTVVTRPAPPVETRTGTIAKSARGWSLSSGAGATPVVFSAHYGEEMLAQWASEGKRLELEGYAELVAGESVFFATRANEAP